MKKILKNKKGFTLVELIVVIAILGVLAVVMVPAFTGYIQKAGDASKISAAKAWCTAYQAYAADNYNTTTGYPTTAAGEELKFDDGKVLAEAVPASESGVYTITVDTSNGSCEVSVTN